LLNVISGLLSGGAAAGGGTSYESIATVTVGAGGSSSISFSSIPSTFKHLQLRGIARGNDAATDINAIFRFNSDSGANYSYHALYGTGSSAGAYSGTSTGTNLVGRFTSGSSSASMFGVAVIDILDYADTNKYKTIRALTGHDQNGSGYVALQSSSWRSTSVVSSITITDQDGGNWVQYSSFALYGIKG